MRTLPIVLVVWLLLLPASLLRAQGALIEPADRVVNFVNVREQPSSASALVGQFRKGEQAVLLLDVPNWYKVRLPGGLEGFVSKAWAQRVATPTPPTPTALGDIPFTVHFLDVGTGDAAIIDIGDREIIIDGGNSPTVLRNYVSERDITDGPVELVIVTHGDTDHWRGLNRLMNFDGNGPNPPNVLEFWDPGYDRLCNPPSDGGRQNYLAFIKAFQSLGGILIPPTVGTVPSPGRADGAHPAVHRALLAGRDLHPAPFRGDARLRQQ